MTDNRIEAERQRIREGARDYYAKREVALRDYDKNVEAMRSQLSDAEQRGDAPSADVERMRSALDEVVAEFRRQMDVSMMEFQAEIEEALSALDEAAGPPSP